MTRWAGLLLMAIAFGALADERLAFCHNWSCAAQVEIDFAESFLKEIGDRMRGAENAAQERELLALALGRFYAYAGARAKIGGDRAGNTVDAEIDGRMDCIDHSNNTTTLLGLFERRGWLRFHRAAEPRFRNRLFVLPVHRSAVIEEVVRTADDPLDVAPGEHFAVDSWLVDPGLPVVILPMDEWLHWGGPDVQ